MMEASSNHLKIMRNFSPNLVENLTFPLVYANNTYLEIDYLGPASDFLAKRNFIYVVLANEWFTVRSMLFGQTQIVLCLDNSWFFQSVNQLWTT